MFGFGPFGDSPFGAIPDLNILPATWTPEGQERLRAYYEQLGRFVDLFARVETTVTHTLWHYAKTSPDVAKVVFAGAKIELSSHYIKQIAEATGVSLELRGDLETVLQQLGIINGARNCILHYGVSSESVAEGNAMVSNALKAKGEPQTFPISPDLLGDMIADLDKIIAHLNHRHLGSPVPRLVLPRRELDQLLRSSWRYKHPPTPKPPQAKDGNQKAQKRGPKPLHRPQASPNSPREG